jgi:hypothetical protein
MKCKICFNIKPKDYAKALITCPKWCCDLCFSTYEVTEGIDMPHPSKNRPRKGRRKIGSKKRKSRSKR